MKKLILTSLVSAAVLAPVASFADTINFTGAVTDQTCTITSSTNGVQTVTLPTVPASALKAAGAVSGGTNFPITLTNCSAGMGTVRAYFESGGGSVNPNGRLSNTAGTGAAKNVDVQLFNTDNTVITPGSLTQNATYVPITNGAATMTYGARYYATGAATSGPVNASVTYSLNFQ